MGLAKVDYQINSKQSLFVRYFGTHSLQPSSFTGTELSVSERGHERHSEFARGWAHLSVSTTVLNTFHFTFNKDGITKFQVPIVTPTDIGVQGMYTSSASLFQHQHHRRFPERRWIRNARSCKHQDVAARGRLSWTKGSHQMQFGVSFIRPSQTSTFCVYCNGLFTFSGAIPAIAMADFVAGALGSIDPVEYLA